MRKEKQLVKEDKVFTSSGKGCGLQGTKWSLVQMSAC